MTRPVAPFLVVVLLLVSPSASSAPPSFEASGDLAAYVDDDNVSVISPTARLGMRNDEAGITASARYLADVVTAASVDIVASASPRWTEVRHAISADAALTRNRKTLSAAAAASFEPDYTALSGGGRLSASLAHDRITLAGGYTLGHDVAGRAGTPFSDFHRTLFRHVVSTSVSFVLGPSSVLSMGFDAVFERGDQSKPYRHVPMFDAAVAPFVPNGASIDLVNRLRSSKEPLELLPLERNRYALRALFLHRSTSATLRAEERAYADTWGLIATTTDLRYAMDLTSSIELSPVVRFHLQQGASFWRRAYALTTSTENAGIPYLRAGDRELGPLWTVTFGGDLRISLSRRFAEETRAVTFTVLRMHSDFLDHLYLDHRDAIFAAAGFEGTFR